MGDEIRRQELVAEFVIRAHSQQVYRGMGIRPDEPYFWHLFRVAAIVPFEYRVVALLHDYLEDIGDDLPTFLLSDERDDIAMLTRDKVKEDYYFYIWRIKERGSLRARAVKLADLHDNMSNLPANHPLARRYRGAIEILTL